MRLRNEGRQRKISQRRSSLRECIVVVEAGTFCFFAGIDGCSGLEWETMASGEVVAWFAMGSVKSTISQHRNCGSGCYRRPFRRGIISKKILFKKCKHNIC
jgi:hypothetical protein